MKCFLTLMSSQIYSAERILELRLVVKPEIKQGVNNQKNTMLSVRILDTGFPLS